MKGISKKQTSLTKHKRRLLFIMPSMGAGGAERVLINLFQLIDHDKYQIDLYVAEEKGGLWSEIPKQVRKNIIFPTALLSKISSTLYRKFGIDTFIRFYGQKISGNYDVAISFLDSVYTEFLFHNSASFEKRVTVVHSSYKTYSNKSKFLKGRYKDVVQKRFGKVDTIVTVSHESLKELKEVIGSFPDMRVIYNPINREGIVKKAECDKPAALQSDRLKFLAIGSLIPVKGFDLLIQGCKNLQEDGYEFELNILGQGYLYKDLQNKIIELDLTGNVFLRGFVSNPYPWIRHSDALVMSSVAEGLPTVLCEAMILGKATLTPDVPGCREIVDYGNYGLVVNRNAEEMAEGLKKLFNKDVRKNYESLATERSLLFDDEKAVQHYYSVFNNQP